MSTVVGVLEWLGARPSRTNLEVVFDNAYPLAGLPISAYLDQRLSWLASEYPTIPFYQSPALFADRLSAFGSPCLSDPIPSARSPHPLKSLNGHHHHPVGGGGLMVYGTGSSAGKGTVALVIGRLLARRGIGAIPYKGAAGISTTDSAVISSESCISTLIHWHCWTESAAALPAFLNPYLVAPPDDARSDGRVSLANGSCLSKRAWTPFVLERSYGDETLQTLDASFSASAEETQRLAEQSGAKIIAEGSGSPLDLMGPWDFANEGIRRLFGIRYVLSTSNDRRGFFSLWGTLKELSHLSLLGDLVGVVVSETSPTAPPRIYADFEHLCSTLFNVPLLGVVAYRNILSTTISEDTGAACLRRLPRCFRDVDQMLFSRPDLGLSNGHFDKVISHL